MKIVTGPITPEQIFEEVEDIAELLCTYGVEDLIVEHGWGSGLEINQMWHPISVKIQEFTAFVQQATKQGIFIPGNSDLTVQDSSRRFLFRFCHDSDIHLATDDAHLARQVIHCWTEKGYGVIGAEAGNESEETPSAPNGN